MPFNKSLRFGIVIFLSAVLLAACTPSQAAAPTGISQIPNTGLATNSIGYPAAPTAADAASQNSTQVSPTVPPYPAVGNSTSNATSSSSTGIKYVLDPSNSSASYAVREQLASLKLPSDAVGKTNSISGQIIINPDGSIDSANSKFTVDITTLQTDSAMRDNYVARNILQSNQFPQAVFVPTKTSGLPAAIPQSGNLSFQLIGDLTIHNVTKTVTWDVTGTISNGDASGTAITSFTFEDFGLHQPSVPIVLSVVDKISLTVTIGLKSAGN
jgi:polyisoprenoid-binding protein YceI